MLAFAAAAIGCGDSLSGGAIPRGTYALVAIDGVPVPVRGTTSTTVRGSLVLANRASYTLTQTDSAHVGAALSEYRSEGSWSLNENALVLHEGGGTPVYLGILAGFDTVRLNLGLRLNVYVRR